VFPPPTRHPRDRAAARADRARRRPVTPRDARLARAGVLARSGTHLAAAVGLHGGRLEGVRSSEAQREFSTWQRATALLPFR
jgi:hypothetical protein